MWALTARTQIPRDFQASKIIWRYNNRIQGLQSMIQIMQRLTREVTYTITRVGSIIAIMCRYQPLTTTHLITIWASCLTTKSTALVLLWHLAVRPDWLRAQVRRPSLRPRYHRIRRPGPTHRRIPVRLTPVRFQWRVRTVSSQLEFKALRPKIRWCRKKMDSFDAPCLNSSAIKVDIIRHHLLYR